MKTPTITKKQAIEAMLVLRKEEYKEHNRKRKEKIEAAERNLLLETIRFLSDSARMHRAVLEEHLDNMDADHTDEALFKSPINVTCGTRETWVSVENIQRDPGVRAAAKAVNDARDVAVINYNDTEIRTELENKLTGCDPQSLLSVPDNVEKLKAVLNSLQLVH